MTDSDIKVTGRTFLYGNELVHVTAEQQKWWSDLLYRLGLGKGIPYPWDEYARRHKIADYLWDRKYGRNNKCS